MTYSFSPIGLLVHSSINNKFTNGIENRGEMIREGTREERTARGREREEMCFDSTENGPRTHVVERSFRNKIDFDSDSHFAYPSGECLNEIIAF